MPRRPRITHLAAPEYPMRTRPSPGIVTTLDVLEVLAETGGPMTFTDVARSLDASSATVHRVLAILVERGYVWRSWRTGRFALTLRLFRLAHAHDPVSRVVFALDGRLQQASAELKRSTYAAMLDDDRLVPIVSAHPAGPTALRVDVGSVVPALHADVGWLLLSHARPNTLRRLLARSAEFQRFRTKERGALRKSLPEMASARCVTNGVGLGPGTRDTAVLIGSGREGLMVAVAVAVPNADAAAEDHAAILTVLRSHGAQVALELGLTAPSRARPPDR